MAWGSRPEARASMLQSDEELDALVEQYLQTDWQVATSTFRAVAPSTRSSMSVERALEKFPNERLT